MSDNKRALVDPPPNHELVNQARRAAHRLDYQGMYSSYYSLGLQYPTSASVRVQAACALKELQHWYAAEAKYLEAKGLFETGAPLADGELWSLIDGLSTVLLGLERFEEAAEIVAQGLERFLRG